ncbi:glycosyltransferase, group 2 family protein [Paraprevotella xylaniphila YIT 11841]|uniref:Glycosyltransferase, group 2 family protein n=1 Tax=Paraprevotella xylaniphila YIT 11841 TaxID=762982 RepID=F3QW83_9BACT|nr:glycosyltransferase [Paraprevotella xylaniphila]EGG52189.1 glycosyltransferase, group 2 family protein [Paraprevotella xylaniphila YIT 11841]
MNKAKISLIVPCYGVERYLDACMNSLVEQTLEDIEIILVDDVSPDRVPEMCDKWASKDHRIKVIHKKTNEGLGYARNSGLDIATGEYVAFIDSDDYVDNKMYEMLYNEAKTKRLDACWCNYRYDLGGKFAESREIKETFTKETADEVKEYMMDMIGPLPEYPSDVKYLVSAWRAIYSRQIIEENDIRFESERDNGSEDIPFNMDFLMHATRIGYIPFVGYNYRYNPLSLSRNYTHAKFTTYCHLFDEVKERFEHCLPENQYKLHYQRFIFYFFRNIIKYEAVKDIGGKKYQNIRMRCDDKRMKDIYSDYPYHRLPLKQRVFFFCMKHRITMALYAMCILENKIRKNV